MSNQAGMIHEFDLESSILRLWESNAIIEIKPLDASVKLDDNIVHYRRELFARLIYNNWRILIDSYSFSYIDMNSWIALISIRSYDLFLEKVVSIVKVYFLRYKATDRNLKH